MRLSLECMRVRAHSTWIPQRESFPMWWFWMQNKHLSSNQCTHIIAIVVHLSEARERLSANVCAFRNYKCVECLVRSFQPKKHIDFLRWNLLLRWLCSIRLFCTRRTDCVRERERLFVDVAYDSIDKTGPIYKIRNNLNSMHAQPIPLEMDWLMKQWN